MVSAIRIGTEQIKQENGYTYYMKCGYMIREPKTMNTTGTSRRVSNEKIPQRKGALYFLDMYGYVSAVPLLRGASSRSKVLEMLKKDAAELRK
jgi:hypothetical protein